MKTYRWRKESGIADLNMRAHVGCDEEFLILPGHLGIFPHFEEKVLAEDDTTVARRTKFRVVKRDVRQGDSMAEWLDYPVHNPAEWEQLKAERLNPDQPGRVALELAKWQELDRKGAALQAGLCPFGVFGTVRDLIGVEEMMVWLYDHPEVVRDMMNHLPTVRLSVYAQLAKHVQIDHIHIWEDMSGKQGSLISPAMVEEFMMPCYDRIVAFAREHGDHRLRIVAADAVDRAQLRMRAAFDAQVDPVLLCKQEAMGSNPIRSIPIFLFKTCNKTPSNLLVNWMVRT